MRVVSNLVLFLSLALGCSGAAGAQTVNVTGRVMLEGTAKGSASNPSSVVWLTPMETRGKAATPVAPMQAVLAQKNKSFEPHLLVVTKGSTVEFPNLDPWFHNVFSLFNGKRFDLGLYEAGSARTVHFDRDGVSYIFCNIHPEMSAIVVVLSTPYFGVANKHGEFSVANVSPGKYMLHVWSDNAAPATLQTLARLVEIGENSHSVGTIHVKAMTSTASHKNKYGQDYEPPSPNNPIYVQH